MHVGHCRGAVFGDALANLLAFAGYDVTREYYVNDAGAQVDTLARSAFLRYREALGEDIGEIPAGLYPGDYLKPVGAGAGATSTDLRCSIPEERWLPLVREAAVAAMLDMIKEDLAALNIRHDVFFSERSLTTAARTRCRVTIEELRAKGLVYEGRLEKPKGHDDADWEDREQTLFKSTAFGDDVDRALHEVGRQLHLFRRRHGLSPQQAGARLPAPDQRVRRRPRRLHGAREGGGGGAVGRQGRSRHQGVPAGAGCSAPASRCACRSAPAPS